MVPAVAPAPPTTRLALPGLLVGAGGMFAVLYSTQAILPTLSRDFHVSPASAGLTISAVVLALAIGSWVWGPLSDRWGRRSTLIRSSALVVVPSIGAALAPTFGLLLACRVLQGLCMPGLLTVGALYVNEVFGRSMGGRAMGYYISALVAGGVVARVGVGLATPLVGWRVALGALAVLPALGALVMIRTLPEAPTHPTSARRRTALGGVLRNRQVRLAALAAGGLFFAFVSVFSYATFRLEDPPFGWSSGVTSLVFVLWAMGGLGPAAGTLADRLGWHRVTLLAVAAATIAVALSIPASPFTFVPALAILAGAMFCGVTAAQIGVTSAATHDRGLASSLYFSAYYASGAAAAFLPGLVWEARGWGGIVVLAAAVLLATGAALLSFGRLRGPG
jgi:YNFM family putative membrane transporter